MTASDLNEGGSLPKWEAVECRVYMGDGGISLHNVPNGVERARLIAAAPDLLEACQLAVVPLGSTGPTPAYEAVLAAIAKATAANSVGTDERSEGVSP
jgi:hypothetical protein